MVKRGGMASGPQVNFNCIKPQCILYSTVVHLYQFRYLTSPDNRAAILPLVSFNYFCSQRASTIVHLFQSGTRPNFRLSFFRKSWDSIVKIDLRRTTDQRVLVCNHLPSDQWTTIFISAPSPMLSYNC